MPRNLDMWDFYTSLHLSLRLDDVVIKIFMSSGTSASWECPPSPESLEGKTIFTIYSFQKNPTICPILRQHTDHANVWVRFLHKQGREVLLEQLVINNLKVAKNGHKYVSYYYFMAISAWRYGREAFLH